MNDHQQRRDAAVGWVGAFVTSLLMWAVLFILALAFFGGR